MPLGKAQTFEEAEDNARVVIQAQFGETWLFHAMRTAKNVNAQNQSDPSRESFSATVIFCNEPRDSKLSSHELVVSTFDPELHIRRCDLKWLPHRGDRVQRCATGALYEIKERNIDSMNGVVLRLLELGRPE